jgi:hypothetical protein
MFAIANWNVRRLAAPGAALLACFTFTAACDSSTDPPPVVIWDAELASDDMDAVVEVRAATASFKASIDIEGADAVAEFTWRIAAGTCTQPGERIGAANRYPALEIANDGKADAEATVSATLDEEADYIAAVLDESGAQPVIVACGPLEVRQD